MKTGATLEQWARRRVAVMEKAMKFTTATRREMILALMEAYTVGAQDMLSDLSADLKGDK